MLPFTGPDSRLRIHSKRGNPLKELLMTADTPMIGLLMTLFVQPTSSLRVNNPRFAEIIQTGVLATGADEAALFLPSIQIEQERRPAPVSQILQVRPRGSARKRKPVEADAPRKRNKPLPTCSLDDMDVMADIFNTTGLVIMPFTHELLERLQAECN